MRVTSCAAAVAVVAGLLLASGAQAADLSPELKKVVEAANKEKTLRLSWGASTLDGANGVKIISEAMRKAFGTNLDFKYSPSTGSMSTVGSRILTEAKAGRPAHTDVFISATTFAARFADDGLYQAVDWKPLLPGRITDDMVEADGTLIRFVSFVAGVTYNTKLIPNPPNTVEGWLRPDLKGKIATSPAVAGFDVLAASDFWGREKALDFSRRFSAQLGGIMRCGEMNRIASGEFQALMFDCGANDTIQMKASGAPVDQIVPLDFVQLRFFHLGVPKNSENPNAAKAFITFMLTQEGQRLAWQLWGTDLHSLEGTETKKQVDALRAQGATPRALDVKWTKEHPEINEAREQILKILRVSER